MTRVLSEQSTTNDDGIGPRNARAFAAAVMPRLIQEFYIFSDAFFFFAFLYNNFSFNFLRRIRC